jgi:hypothetical protein
MSAVTVVDDYFAALARRDVETMASLWAADGDEHIAGQVDAIGPNGVRELAALEPSAAWPGHADALKGDVHGQLERAAAESWRARS